MLDNDFDPNTTIATSAGASGTTGTVPADAEAAQGRQTAADSNQENQSFSPNWAVDAPRGGAQSFWSIMGRQKEWASPLAIPSSG